MITFEDVEASSGTQQRLLPARADDRTCPMLLSGGKRTAQPYWQPAKILDQCDNDRNKPRPVDENSTGPIHKTTTQGEFEPNGYGTTTQIDGSATNSCTDLQNA